MGSTFGPGLVAVGFDLSYHLVAVYPIHPHTSNPDASRHDSSASGSK